MDMLVKLRTPAESWNFQADQADVYAVIMHGLMLTSSSG